jgi:hypothetical protein
MIYRGMQQMFCSIKKTIYLWLNSWAAAIYHLIFFGIYQDIFYNRSEAKQLINLVFKNIYIYYPEDNKTLILEFIYSDEQNGGNLSTGAILS